MNFNCASDTHSLVAVMSVHTSHWYHAGCGMQMKLVRLGSDPKEAMQLQGCIFCIGCRHASEMFGFVKLCKGLGSRDLDERALLCLEDRRGVCQTR